MQSVLAVFDAGGDAYRAARQVQSAVPEAHVSLLTPQATLADLERLPTDEGEQPGTGAAVGGVVGGAVGMAAATLLLPAAGPIALIGLAGGAIAGVASGMKVGDKLEDVLSHGVPRDELVYYEDELRRGRSIAVAVIEDDDQAARARDAMASTGTARIDPARHNLSVGLH